MAGTRIVYIAYVPREPLRFNKARHKTGMELSGMQVLMLNTKIMRSLDTKPGMMAYVYISDRSKHASRAIFHDDEYGYVCMTSDDRLTAYRLLPDGKMKFMISKKEWRQR